MKRKLLFVDDEKNVLTGLQRMLRAMREEWDMAFLTSGEEALSLLKNDRFDVIISDIRMPGMDGLKLLTQIKEQYPEMIRIVLSGESNPELLLKSTGVSHQFLSKPCSTEILKNTISRTYSINNMLSDEAMKRIIAGMDRLPSMPSLYGEIISVLNSPNSSLKQVGEIISRDIGMSAKILQLVNSSYFGLSREISNPAQAASLLGMNTIKSLVLSIHIFSRFELQKIAGVSIDELWNHNMMAGLFSKTIMKIESQNQVMIDNAFLSGMLHDSGKLILGVNFPEKYASAMSLMRTENLSILESEQRLFGTTHAKVGAYLLGMWGLPVPVVEAIAYHHQPSECTDCVVEGFSVLAAVHLADTFASNLPFLKQCDFEEQLDMNFLRELNMNHKIELWADTCWSVVKEEMVK